MKNRLITYIIVPILTIIMLNACNEEEFLDELPKGISVAKTTSDFRKLLDAVDNERYSHSFSQTVGMLDILTDNVSIDSTTWNSWTYTKQHFKELYIFNDYVWTYDALRDDPNWKPSYYIISLASTILEEIEKVTDNSTEKKQLIAEAKTHRAYAYLMLVGAYAKAYDISSATSDLGVPIINKPSALPSLERNTIKEVYDFIIKDLNEALEDLPDDITLFNHRPSKTAVYAILARTYLYMGDYQKALENAEKSLQIRNYLYDLNTQYEGDIPTYNAISKISRLDDQEILLHKTTSKGLLSRTYMLLDTISFDAIYPGFTKTNSIYNNLDLRRTLWFYGWNADNTSKNSTNNYHFSFYGNNPVFRYGLDNRNSDAANNIPITTAEMYLIRAESSARLGNLQQALDDINKIGKNRYKENTYQNITLSGLGGDQNSVINVVLAERRRELYGKELRLMDVKRLHLPVVHYLGSAKISVPANDPRLILPIFDNYIEQNPELQQNDRTSSGVTIQSN